MVRKGSGAASRASLAQFRHLSHGGNRLIPSFLIKKCKGESKRVLGETTVLVRQQTEAFNHLFDLAHGVTISFRVVVDHFAEYALFGRGVWSTQAGEAQM